MRAALLIALAAGCAPATPDAPMWLADVRPILAANCIRCHGHPAIGGAPATFRLDVYEDGFSDGRIIRGAKSMAGFIAARAAIRGDMPPRGTKLSGRQKDILEKWQATTEVGARPDDSPPTAKAEIAIGAEMATFDVLVSDADGDLVQGELRAGELVVGPLRAGRQQLVWDLGVVPAVDTSFVAVLDDGDGPVMVDLGRRTLESRPDLAWTIELSAPLRDALFHDRDGSVLIAFSVANRGGPTMDRVPLVDLEASDGRTTVPIVTGLRPDRGQTSHAWDISAVPEGPSWRIRATVTDGKTARTAVSQSFIVSHAATAETYDTVKPLVDAVCARCHDPLLPSGPDFAAYEDLRDHRGIAWRKVWQLREMPPKSMSAVLDDPTAFSEEDRRRLGGWLFAGAPR